MKLKYITILVSVLILCCNSYAGPTELEDVFTKDAMENRGYSVTEKGYAINVLTLVDSTFSMMDECKKLFQGKEYVFDFHKYLWDARNFVEISAAELVWKTIAPAARADVIEQRRAMGVEFFERFNLKSKDERRRTCSSLVNSMVAGKIDFSVGFENESKQMLGIFEASMLGPNVRRNKDFTVGCIKKHYNEGRNNPAAAISECRCNTAALLDAVPEDEIDPWLSGADVNNPESLSLEGKSWSGKLMKSLAECRIGKK